ncbi:COPI associated protein [Cryptosporidium felis]|nr:COPI associated protein [Cryptosporidium felis]
MSENHPSRKKTTFKIFILELTWIGFFVVSIGAGITDLILYYDTKRMVVNIFIVVASIISLLAEAYCFSFYSYLLFMYTPIGRGLFMIILTCLQLNDNIFSMVVSLVLFVNSVFYLTLSAIFGGINKPLFNSSLKHELDFKASIYFINNTSKSKNKSLNKYDQIANKKHNKEALSRHKKRHKLQKSTNQSNINNQDDKKSIL